MDFSMNGAATNESHMQNKWIKTLTLHLSQILTQNRS